MKVTVSIDANKILQSRGLGKSTKVQQFLASEVRRQAEPYTPMQSKDLINRVQIASDGSEIVYTQPYAHYQYYGQVMAGRAPKHYTGDKLTYNGAPMRGARWVERMIADKRQELEKSVEEYIKRG